MDSHDTHQGHATLRRVTNVAVLLLGLLFSSLDASIVYTSLIQISLSLQNFVKAPWVVLSYLLAYIGLAIPFAKASDIWGRRTMLLIAWILFTIGSLACGLASSIGQLIGFRAIQGVGGSGLYSMAQVGLFEVGPSHRPQLLGALIAITLAISFVLGPVLGGTITSLTNWKWLFLINVPFGIVAMVALAFAWPKIFTAGDEVHTCWQVLNSIDPPGVLLSSAASSLIVAALATSDSPSSALNLGITLAVVGVLSGIAFVCWEIWLGSSSYRKSSRLFEIRPMIPMRLFRDRIFVGASLCCWFTGWLYLSVLVILPERFQIVNKEGPLIASVRLLPMLGTTALGSFLAGALCKKRNITSILLIVSQCLQAIGIGLFMTLRATSTESKAQNGFQVILGLGVGLSFGSATILTHALLPKQLLAIGQGIVAQMRVFGGAIGIAVCSLTYNWTTEAQRDHFNPNDIDLIKNNPVVQQFLPPQLQELTKANFVHSFNTDILVILTVGLIGVAMSLLVLDRSPPILPFQAQDRINKDVMGSAIELRSRDSHQADDRV